MSADEKVKYFMSVFNNDINSCIRLCDTLISKCIVRSNILFYEEVKSKLQLLTK